MATLVQAVVNSRIDYCSTILAGAPRTVTEKLQRVLNATLGSLTAAWIRYCMMNFTGSTSSTDRVFFKLAVTVHRCVNGRAPPYLSDYCVPITGADSRRHLRSADRQLLAVPSLPAQHLRPSDLFSCRPHSLELSPGLHPGPDRQCRLFETFA